MGSVYQQSCRLPPGGPGRAGRSTEWRDRLHFPGGKVPQRVQSHPLINGSAGHSKQGLSSRIATKKVIPHAPGEVPTSSISSHKLLTRPGPPGELASELYQLTQQPSLPQPSGWEGFLSGPCNSWCKNGPLPGSGWERHPGVHRP